MMDRLPAIPLIANDPYFSIWLPADLPTQANTVHWSGVRKWLRGSMFVDGKEYRFLGKSGRPAAQITRVEVTPTRSIFQAEAAGVRLDFTFWTPTLPDDLDVLSTPISYVDFSCTSIDGQTHNVSVKLMVPDTLCFDGETRPELQSSHFHTENFEACCLGQKVQKVLCHSGDRITIDWGYLYVAAKVPVRYEGDKVDNVVAVWALTADSTVQQTFVMLAYDDVASINYFGAYCRAWYARNGKTIVEALDEFSLRHDELLTACEALDTRILNDAMQVGGKDYQKIIAAAWRQTFAANKLIATPQGEMAWISKENDSNGCMDTVDVSYPATPIYLKYCPELVNAMCRPVLYYASLPVWKYDFAPHDVGRYPHATGQAYAFKKRNANGQTYMPFYLFTPDEDVFSLGREMPVEESGNMLIMLASAVAFGADDSLARTYMDMLGKWVRYLDEFGEDPGEQLCTDDFAGHLAHNVNLSAKAMMGLACYAQLLERFGRMEEAAHWNARAKAMAESFMNRVGGGDFSPLTFDGQGWSMKYNLVWDFVLNFHLLPQSFYTKELNSYLDRINTYGLPLDSRDTYTKSDWLCWCAAMASADVRQKLMAPLARYLEETSTRVPFSDWYDTVSGDYVAFIGRSVQGGVFMPMLIKPEK